MPRNTLEGVYLPRTDIVDWEINIGGTPYRRSAPGPVASAKIQLDGIGCLTSGSIVLKKPGSIPRPFEQQVLISVLSKTRGWIPICRGCLPPANPDGPQEWTLTLQPGEVRDLDGYYDGSLTQHNTLNLETIEYTDTNKTVVDRTLKAHPDASIGVDWAGTVILARPTDGSPVRVSKARFYGWKMTAAVVLPYGTESRWAGEKGWAKGEYLGITRPPCTPRKAVDAGPVTYNEGLYPTGPRLLHQKEIIVNYCANLDDIVTASYLEQSAVLPADKPFTHKVRAEQYALVSVYDVQKWYEQSALAGQNDDNIKKLEEQVATLQSAYNLAKDTLGEGHSVTVKNAEELADAENYLRLEKVNGIVESFYAPLSAQLSFGFVGQSLGDSSQGDRVLTGLRMWVSTTDWDANAVGPPLDRSVPNPDPQAPLAADIPGVEGDASIHPLASSKTLILYETDLRELTQVSNGKPWQSTSQKIPDQLYKAPMGKILAMAMDAKWQAKRNEDELERETNGTLPEIRPHVGQNITQSFGAGATLTGDLPPGMTFTDGLLYGKPTEPGEYTVTINGETKTIWVYSAPPSRAWDGRWYFHVAAWWQAVRPWGAD